MEKDKVFDIYEESFVQNTENCSNSEIVDISTGLYRISRAFQYHNNWDTFLLVSTAQGICKICYF